MTDLLDVLVDRLVHGYDPDRIILFGSHASGRSREDSDIDLIIVKETNRRPLDRRVEAHRLVADLGVPIDIRVYTPAELRMLYLMGSPFVEDAIETGRVLYMRRATAAWLHEATDELETARLLVAHERLPPACLHSQQAVEKALKALLLEQGVRPPRTHDLVELLNTVRGRRLDTNLSMDDAVFLTNVYRSRYPSEEGLLPHSEPTVEDAMRALTAADRVLQSARHLLESGKTDEDSPH